MRVGIPKEYHVDGLASSVMQAWNAAARYLEARGATILPVSLPQTQNALAAYYVIAPAEASSNLAKFDGVRYGKFVYDFPLDNILVTRSSAGHRSQTPRQNGTPLYATTRTEGFGDEVQRRIMLGTFVLQANSYTSYFQQAQKIRRLVQADFDRVFAGKNPLHPASYETASSSTSSSQTIHVLLTPSAITPAPLLATATRYSSVGECTNDAMTVPASLAGLPALAVPFGRTEGGESVGVQLIGQYGDDDTVLAVGEILEGGWEPFQVACS
ncbi:Trimeric GatFAB AmidoTransferase(AdT) complex subunit [Thoreauomyces humboldtii]|nr:Trimeric GatFAB AmidoTransferase(AdT) complex subunit [Thoreauomyces humboldtii]